MRLRLSGTVLAFVMVATIAFATGLEAVSQGSISSTSQLATVRALELPRFTPLKGGTAAQDLDTIFVVEDVHPDYDDSIGLTFYILNPADLKKSFATGMFNVSVWYYDATGVSTFTGASTLLDLETQIYSTLRPSIDLSNVAFNDTYVVKGRFVYHQNHDGPPLASPFIFHLEAK